MLQTVHFPVDSTPPRNLTDNFTVIMQMISDMNIEEKIQTSVDTLKSQALEEAKLWFSVNKKAPSAESVTSTLRTSNSWQPPNLNLVKCNVNASWRNATAMVGAAWILRDHQGNVLFHSRDAFTPSGNRLFAELRCISWALQSIHDMSFRDVILGIDSHDAFQAISNAITWSRYRHLLDKIKDVRSAFESVIFKQESTYSNSIA
ncbi:uncharacterized protein LOC117127813 [Brassica rapa]|uniref:uncharacterized protein LOC117127813 n=1 Tax=Brassica campestris TaxID=3711 RepID=UPI00142E8688|nr:uncharacterized protein LOC117127813 [Brassica rapa]